MTRIANQHQQRGLKRFLFCLVVWFLVTQCDYEWVFNSVENYFNPNSELESEQGSNSGFEGFKDTGKALIKTINTSFKVHSNSNRPCLSNRYIDCVFIDMICAQIFIFF